MVPRLNRSALSLYLVFGPQDLRPGVDPSAFMAAAIDGGVTCVQWRDKSASASAPLRDRVQQCRPLVALARDRAVPLLINDDLDLTQALEADGLHLGQDDVSPRLARRTLGEDAILGWSVGTPTERARFNQIEAEDPTCLDYLGVGPAFGTTTKADAGESLGPQGISTIIRGLSLPRVAIGGINQANCHLLTGCGLDGIAVISAITKRDDPHKAAQDLRNKWKSSVSI